MDFSLDQIILDNSIREYLISAGIITGVFLLRNLLSRMTAYVIARLVVTKKRKFDYSSFQELVLAPIELFVTVMGILVAMGRLNFPEALNVTVYKTNLQEIIHALARATVIGCFILLCNRIIIYISKLLLEAALGTSDKADDQLVMFFRDFLKVLIWILGILLMLKYALGFDLGNILTGLSIVGAAVALAFRESLENLIASFIVFFNKPFTVGDLVKVENISGTVEKIGLRSTRVRTAEKTYVTVPNKKMVDSILDNHTLRTQRNVSNRLELELRSQPAAIRALIADIETLLNQTEGIEESQVFLADTGQQANIVQLDYFVTMDIPVKAFFKLRENINLQLLELLQKHGLELAAEHASVVVRK